MASTSKSATTKKKAAAVPAVKRRRRATDLEHKPAGIGAYVVELLLKGKSTEQILELVARQFPDAHTSRSSIAWYKSRLRAEGKL